MRALTVILALSLASLAVAPAVAQEGHPLKGSWIGEWEGNDTHGDDVLVILDWDGRNITGMINPGTDNIPIKNATLDPDGWLVRFEADAEDASGNAVNYVVEGTIENISFHNRSIVGTWKSQAGSGRFEISRQ